MLDKAIKHKKEWRKQYYGSKAFDRTCRCHGSCSYCENNRVFSTKKRILKAKKQMEELLEDLTPDIEDHE